MFYHEGWLNSGNQSPVDNWVQTTDSRSLVRANRGANQWSSGGNYSPNGVAINNAGSGGCCNSNERSDWACATILLYNRTLSTDEMLQVENFLYEIYKFS